MLRKLANNDSDQAFYLRRQNALDQARLKLCENRYSVERLKQCNKDYSKLTAQLNPAVRKALEGRTLSNAKYASSAYQKLIEFYQEDPFKFFEYCAAFATLDTVWQYFERVTFSIDELIQLNNTTEVLASQLEGELSSLKLT